MNDICNSLIIKRWWRFRTQPSLWAKFLIKKYCKIAHPVKKVATSVDSHTWKSLMQIKEQVERHIIWKVQEGNSSFWWDNWTGIGALAKLCQGPGKSPKLLINSFFVNKSWNTVKLSSVVPNYIVKIISSIVIGNNTEKDYPIWNDTENGVFTNYSAWQIVRKQRPKNNFLNNIWHNKMPFKISFLNWRMFKRRLPFNDIITRLNINSQNNCFCCRNAHNDTMYHVFGEGEEARQLWSMMGNPLGIQHKNQPMTNIFSAWWETKPENAIHKTILKINPIIICWEIWKQWYSCKYGGKKYLQTNKMCYQTVHTIKSVLANTFQNFRGSNHWPSFCLEVERLRPVQIMKQVTWSCPQNGIIKINTDGSYVHETGRAGIGGIIRNSCGDLIMAFSFPIECKNSNMAEAMAVEFGVKWCNQHGYTNFIL